MANKKSKSNKDKKKDQKKNAKKSNNGNNEQQPNKKGNLPCIDGLEDLAKLSFDQMVKLFLNEKYRDEIRKICAHYTKLELYGSEINMPAGLVKKANFMVQNENEDVEQLDENGTKYKIAFLVINDAQISNQENKVAYCEALADMFSNIKLLNIIYHPRMNSLMPLLLKNWDKNGLLTNMHVIGGSQKEEFITTFWKALRFTKSLSSLVWRQPTPISSVINNQTQMLGQMEYIHIDGYQTDIVPLFRQFGDKLTELAITRKDKINLQIILNLVNFSKLEKVFKQVPKSCVNLEKISLINPFDEPEKILSLFVDRCKHLSSFNLSGLTKCSITFLLAQLTKLPNITEFNIGPPLSMLTDEVAAQFKPFLKVKSIFVSLAIHPSMAYTVEQFEKTFGLLFPNLEKLKIACFDQQLGIALKAAANRCLPKLVNPVVKVMHKETGIFEELGHGEQSHHNDENREDIGPLDKYGLNNVANDEDDNEEGEWEKDWEDEVEEVDAEENEEKAKYK